MREPGRKVVVFFCSLGTARAPKAYTIANALLEKNPHLRKRLELFHTGLTDGPINKPGRYFLKGTEEREAGFTDMHTIVPLDRDVQLTIRGLLKIHRGHGGPQINTVEEHGIDGDNIDHEKMLALLEKIAATKETKPPEKHRFM